ncbi:MAG: CoA transferase [Actinomycetia bacterium]|nr:CoA transferase [Actinomycetes bacterium]MCH9800061.1 CoA transferase [Actinomycetes bacterium]
MRSRYAGVMPDSAPLAGIRVLDAGTFIAAPFAATVLSEFGAEVIKIENPKNGDPWRNYGTATNRDGDTLAWLSEARNRSSLPLDLRQPQGAEIFRALVEHSDVVCENFRPGTLERWGLGWEELSARNPGLILLRVSGFGQTGPYRSRPGFARIAQAFGGLTHLAGMPDGPPVTPGSTSLADYTSGLYGAIGVLLALRERDRSGRGQVVDVALYESIFRLLDELAPAYAATGTVRDREGTGTALACPHGHFPTADDRWVAIACTSDRMFERLTVVMQRPDLLERFRFAPDRLAHRAEVEQAVTDFTRSRQRGELLRICEAGDVPCGPINTIADIFDDPQVAARGNLQQLHDTEAGDVVVPGVVPSLSRTPGAITSLGPAKAAGATRILTELLDLSADQIAELRDAGVIDTE